MTSDNVEYRRGVVDAKLAFQEGELKRLEAEAREARRDGRAELQATEQRLLERVDELRRSQIDGEQRIAQRIQDSERRSGERVGEVAQDVRVVAAQTAKVGEAVDQFPKLLAELRQGLKEDAQEAAAAAVRQQQEANKPSVTQRLVTVIYVLLGLLAAAHYGVGMLPQILGLAP